MWLATLRPNPDYRRDFTYPHTVIHNRGGKAFGGQKKEYFNKKECIKL